MTQSSEYPDLRFVPPRAYGTGRDGKAVRYIVIHYTAGAERSTSAEDGAAYDQDRTDGTSTHYFVDSDSVVQCVLTSNRGNAARTKGNRLGIQYELCGTAQTRAQWLDAASLPTLRNAAKQVARDCRKYDIPVRRLSVVETRRAWTEFPEGPRGIVGHVDCTNAYPEDGGDHTDPGPQFPWGEFLGMVQAEMEDDMPTIKDIEDAAYAGTVRALSEWPTKKADRVNVGNAVWNTNDVIPAPGNPKPGTNPDGSPVKTHILGTSYLQGILNATVEARNLARGEALEVPPTADQNANAVLAQLAAAGRSSADVADALRAALGDRAAEVGRLLAS